MIDFPRLDHKRAAELVALAPEKQGDLDRRRKFRQGDHFQEGAAWTGMRAAPDDPNAKDVTERLRRLFTSSNKIAEIVRRHRDAAVGTSPNWTLTPSERGGRLRRFISASLSKVRRALKAAAATISGATGAGGADQPAQTPPADEVVERVALVDAALVEWWDKRQAHEKFKKAIDRYLYCGRGSLRFFIPPALVNPDGSLKSNKPRTLEEALDLIHIAAPEPDRCRLVTDEETQARAGIFIVEADTERDKMAELTYLLPDGRTVVRVVRPGDEARLPGPVGVTDAPAPEAVPPGRQIVVDLGGRLTMFEIETDEPLVSEQIIQHNQLLNLAMTHCGHNVLEAGFSELFLFNVQMPTKEVADPNSPTGKREVEETTIQRGYGAFNRFVGVRSKRADGNGYEYATPSAEWKEPSPIATFADTKRLAYTNILEEAQQLHALLAGDAAPSGESRIQALADFVVSLKGTKTQADAMGLWMLETALRLAAWLMGDASQFDDLVLSFDTKIDTGRLTPAERTALLSEVERRLRSRQSAMILLGIDDPDAELRQIEQESQRLNPMDATQAERARFLLERDRRAAAADGAGGDDGIGARLDALAQGGAGQGDDTRPAA
jgi:hypothetical protein